MQFSELVGGKWPNWVDLLVVILFLRMCYSGQAHGLLWELLHLVGLISVTALTLNFSTPAAQWLESWLRASPILAAAVGFWGLFLGLLAVKRLLVKLITHAVKWEGAHWAIHGLGGLLGGIRGLWWSGFILIALSLSGWTYVQESVEQRSILGPGLVEVSRKSLTRVADCFPGAQARGQALIPSLGPVPR
ncbi:MAG: CvpA family protein [Candidatus Omnitrophota bacterium]|nr:CvpA family protein [Candidatus Omnitrophota bacterium]